jgi:probable HAF family extracellular repeat protein
MTGQPGWKSDQRRLTRTVAQLVLLHLSLIAILSSILFSQSSGTTATPAHYKIIELPLKPLYLSESGEVVGTVGGERAAVWSLERGLRLLDLPEGTAGAEGRASNRLGDVVGFARSRDYSVSRAFIYKAGKLIVLPGDRAKAFAINDSSAVVGESSVKGKIPTQPVLWKGDTLTDLGTCCGGVANGINNAGQVAGNMYDQQGRYHAFLWDPAHGLKYLGASDTNTSAIAINAQGHVLLQQFEKGVFLYRGDGEMVRLTSPTGAIDPRGMNNSDMVVGGYGSFSDASKAFLWDEKHGLRNLNELLPGNSDWKLESAAGINDAGQIIGVGDHKGNEDAGFMLIEERSARPDPNRH